MSCIHCLHNLTYCAYFTPQDVSVQKDDFLIGLTGLHSNFKCMDPRHGKIVLPEELVQTEIEAVKEKNKVDHDNLHLQYTDKKMLRDANIESVALDEAEQERMIREYNKERDERRRQQKSSGGAVAQESNKERYSTVPTSTNRSSRDSPSSSHSVHRQLTQDRQPLGSQLNPRSETTPKPKIHIYDTLAETYLGDHSRNEGPITRQNSQSTNGTSVDPSHTYSNIPGAGNGASTTLRATGPPLSDDQPQHQFVMGSRVQFGDPPQYGEIRWMGNVPQVEGLIAGVELVGH